MSSSKKLLQAAAGSAGGAGLNIEDVFSTYLYEGNGSTQTITNGIDLSGEGGLVWIKSRSWTYPHNLYDTERGATKRLKSSSTSAESTLSTGLTAFSSTGFTLGGDNDTNGTYSSAEYASWTFRKAPKFFDVVTYTGNGTAGHTISHNLGSVPGCIIIKELNNTSDWIVYHRGIDVNGDNAPETDYINLNKTSAAADGDFMWNDTAPTATDFTLGYAASTNQSGYNFVAYLFAHNDGDGEFGPDGDADIIKCGSYTGNGSTNGPEIDLGFEPQWIMIKRASNVSGWYIWDTMRGIVSDGSGDAFLYANASDSEDPSGEFLKVTPTGFKLQNAGLQTNGSSNDYIYIAIRRGPMAVPESATDVFNISYGTATAPWFDAGFPVDLGMHTNKTGYSTNARVVPRLTSPNYLYTSSTSAEISADTTNKFDYMEGYNSGAFASTDFIAWMWKRAPNFFDVVAYTGNGTAGRTVSHNLGVAPEMMWVKSRSNAQNWYVYHKDVGIGSYLTLQTGNAPAADTYNWIWNSTAPTSTEFTVSTFSGQTNYTYITYLFASLNGISKVGSYTGNGTSQTIDCGFSSGARFVLIKRTDSTGDWYIWDTERGIVAANDPHLSLNTTAAEVTTDDSIDPVSSGFAVNQVSATNINVSSASYIFYAVS